MDNNIADLDFLAFCVLEETTGTTADDLDEDSAERPRVPRAIMDRRISFWDRPIQRYTTFDPVIIIFSSKPSQPILSLSCHNIPDITKILWSLLWPACAGYRVARIDALRFLAETRFCLSFCIVF